MTTIHYPAGARAADMLLHDHMVPRIWDRDISVWGATPGSADAKSIETRLGWLDVSQTIAAEVDRILALADSVKADGIRHVYLLGMGGSSLCAEVISSVFGVADGYPQLTVLDTTDERTITRAASASDPVEALFIVASKSGGTVEVASMERFFWRRMKAALGRDAGRHFVAITDPGTALQQLAESRRYREVFLNPADIGGRFSALSLFGLVPAALIGAPMTGLDPPARRWPTAAARKTTRMPASSSAHSSAPRFRMAGTNSRSRCHRDSPRLVSGSNSSSLKAPANTGPAPSPWSMNLSGGRRRVWKRSGVCRHRHRNR